MIDISQVLSLALFLGILALFAAIIYFMFRGAQRQKAQKEANSAALGFHPVSPDKALQERIFSLHTHARKRPDFSLSSVFVRNSPDGQIYLYDLHSNDSEGYTVQESSAVAFVCPGWNLPRFSIYPRLEQSGRAASLANRLVTWLASRDMPLIPFEDRSEFNHKYLVTGQEPDRVQTVLNLQVRSRLASLPGIILEAGQDVFTMAWSRVSVRIAPEPVEQARSLVDAALAFGREMG